MRPTNWKEHKKQLLANLEVMAEYEKLRPEFEIAMQIIRYRVKNKMTQSELAEKANTKQAVISRLESGSNNTTIKELSKIFAALGKELKIQVR